MTNETEKLIEEAEKITEHVPGDWTACKCNKCGLVWALGEMHIVTVELETEDSDVPQPSPEQRRRIMDFMARSRSMIPELAAALRRAETERDAQAKEFARFKAVAALANSVVHWDSLLNEMHEQKARARRAETERDELLEKVKELEATRDLLLTENARLQEHCARDDAGAIIHECPPPGEGVMPCCGVPPFERRNDRIATDERFVNCDRMRLLTRVGELTSANLLLTSENARLQKEHSAYVQRLSADAIHVASKYQRERDEARNMEADTARRSFAEIESLKSEANEARCEIEDLNRRVAELHGQRDAARAQIATLELLRRGGK